MNVLARWIRVCPVHGADHAVYENTGRIKGCFFWSSDDAQCREAVEWVRLTSDRGAVVIDEAAEERAIRALCADEAWEDDWMIAANVVGVVVAALRGQ